MSAIHIGRGGGRWGGGTGEVDVEEVPRPETKCRQYLSSMAKCAHVLSAPVFPTPGTMSRRLRTMDFLFVCSTPPRCLLWLNHAARSLVGIWLSKKIKLTVLNVNVTYYPIF